ncbi:type I glyceraldehyde-3-phosphate dehydrogenase [Candidatus Nomurabacteria bacterium]|nr:type I glyceraldehyde-3-phosphate dehydrogenase [Candidatus Nomurabacteria bacterium]
MSKIRVAINGFGRIGRAFFKLAQQREEIEIVAINDLGDIDNLAYLLKYDSVYGRSGFEVEVKDGNIIAGGHLVRVVQEKDPSKLPWGEMKIDVVVESTGFFTKFADARAHVMAGAKRVVISAPAKDDPSGESEGTILMGVNEDKFATCVVSSNASCTTNAGSPVMTILSEGLGIKKAVLNTVHAYTASQSLVDGPAKKDLRSGRAAALNIIPATTGAAIATTKVLPSLEGKFDGISLRVPVPVGSIADITFISKKKTTVEKVNEILKKAATEDRWKGIFAVTDEPIVSQDIVGNTHASIADLSFTKVVDGDLVKVLAWYDNEIGYTNSLVEHVIKTGSVVVSG